MTATTTAAWSYRLPPLLSKQGVAELLGVTRNTVDDWRAKTLRDLREGRTPDFPEPDRIAEGRMFWYPATIVAWAASRGRLPAGWVDIELPPTDLPLWTQADIAAHFGVDVSTVRQRWRFFHQHAVIHELEMRPKAIVKEDFTIDSVPFWWPANVIRWGQEVGKLDRDGNPLQRNGMRWVADPVEEPITVDPIADLIEAGERWTRLEIAEFFGVKVRTVSMWGSPWSAGQNFPEPDGGSTVDGRATWLPDTIKAWGAQNRRLDEDGQPRQVAGGRIPGRRTKPPTTAAQFAASLHEAGCTITWAEADVEFAATHGHGESASHVTVCFHRNGDGFDHAKHGKRTLHSMIGVRRQLGLEPAQPLEADGQTIPDLVAA